MAVLLCPISWSAAARKAFAAFPAESQGIILNALTIAAEGQKADIAKLLAGLGSGIFEDADAGIEQLKAINILSSFLTGLQTQTHFPSSKSTKAGFENWRIKEPC